MLVVASKVVSRAEGRFVDLRTVRVSEKAAALAKQVGLDERVVEVVLGESVEVSRTAPGVLIVKIDSGGLRQRGRRFPLIERAPLDAPYGSGPWALTLPESPDGTAEKLRATLETDSTPPSASSSAIPLGVPFGSGASARPSVVRAPSSPISEGASTSSACASSTR